VKIHRKIKRSEAKSVEARPERQASPQLLEEMKGLFSFQEIPRLKTVRAAIGGAMRPTHAMTLVIAVLLGCSGNPQHCHSKGMGVDRNGNCTSYCDPDGGVGCAANEQCKSISQPTGDPHSNAYTTAFVCCSGSGC
jgi:hypothetical protein